MKTTWFQFGLRTLLEVVTMAAILFALFRANTRPLTVEPDTMVMISAEFGDGVASGLFLVHDDGKIDLETPLPKVKVGGLSEVNAYDTLEASLRPWHLDESYYVRTYGGQHELAPRREKLQADIKRLCRDIRQLRAEAKAAQETEEIPADASR